MYGLLSVCFIELHDDFWRQSRIYLQKKENFLKIKFTRVWRARRLSRTIFCTTVTDAIIIKTNKRHPPLFKKNKKKNRLFVTLPHTATGPLAGLFFVRLVINGQFRWWLNHVFSLGEQNNLVLVFHFNILLITWVSDDYCCFKPCPMCGFGRSRNGIPERGMGIMI